ncbi:phage tail tape measure protein [Crocosphaera sp.]|uniref:phage tail tape measure protein n=1 Tax=Crocosphaera sp. TaxID=2729996 RepID=UPI00262E42C0|nr:phage tail tape measure protein [Crocosphaera sp.]MDJ0579669.1 phage tail tape measure protein [Crocosphaera sp.]
MDNQESYGLRAQFDFIVKEDNFSRMSATQDALRGIRKELEKLEKTSELTGFQKQFDAMAKASVKSTDAMGRGMDNFADDSKRVRNELSPLRAEFRALKKEVRNIEFGEIYDFKAFRKAEKETRNYIKQFERLERQIKGTTFAEREFTASLKQQQRVLDTKIGIQYQERLAARSAERVGQFQAAEQIGRNMVLPFVREGKKATDALMALNDQLSSVEAKTGATTEEMKKLEKIALRLGATSSFTASQAASAEVYLGQAGFNAREIYAALPSVLGLAGSDSSIDLAMSADITSNVLSAYELDAMKDTARVADILAKIASKTNTNVAQLGEAFTYGGTQAKMFNVSLEETSALLGVAGDIGIQASSAGMGLRSGLANLADASKQAKLKKAFGVDVVDQKGQIRDIIDIMGDLSIAYTKTFEERPAESLDALTKVFGKTAVGFWSAQINNYSKLQRDTLIGLASGVEEQKLADILGINIQEGQNLYDQLIKQTGNYNQAVEVLKKGIDDLIQSGRSGQGAALAMSSIMQNNLGGAFRSLSSALEAFRLAYIKPLEPLIITTTNAIAGLLRFFANLPEPIRFVISSMALLTVTMGTALVVIGSVSAALFGFSQAAATAGIATTALARGGMIPLTGFFNEAMGGLRGAFELDSIIPSLSNAFGDLQNVVVGTGGATLVSFGKVSTVVKLLALDFLQLSRAFLLSPLGLTIGTFLALNTVVEKLVPGLNLMGIALSGITAITGFSWGVVKGFTEAIFDFLGVTRAGGLGVISPIFESIGNAISMAAKSFELFSQTGENLGKTFGKILVSPFLWAGRTIVSIWQMTINAIRQPLRPFADFVQSIGKLLVSFLAENSPGPTYLIREKWGMTIDFLKTQFDKLIHFAKLVNQAFLGIGDITAEERGNARIELLQGTLNMFIGGIKLISSLFSLWQQFRNWQNQVIKETISNMDLLGFSLLTLSSLPMTLADQLLPTAKNIVKELALLTDAGIFRGLIFTFPGIIASLIFTGTLNEFEQGFSDFLKQVPSVLSNTLDNLYSLISDEFKTQFNQGVSDAVTDLVKSAPSLFPGSETFAFAFDLDTVYQQTQNAVNTTLSSIVNYLLVVGTTAQQVGRELVALLKPLLEFNVLNIFPQLGNIPIISALASVPLVPNFTVVQPFIKGLLEVLRSPEIKMLVNFLRSNVLDVFLKSLISVYETLQLITGVSFSPVIIPLMYGVDQVSLLLRSIILDTGILVKNFADLSVTGVSIVSRQLIEVIRTIPFVGEGIITTFINVYRFISNISKIFKPFAIQYGRFLLGLIPTQSFKDLFFSLLDLAKVGLEGFVIFTQKNIAPLANILLKAFNPLSFFKILKLYFTTGGFQGLLKKGLFSITPYDFLFGNRNIAFLGRIFLDTVFPANIIRKRTTEIFQNLASPQAAAEAAKTSRRLGRTVLVPLEEILNYVPGGTKVFIRFAQAAMIMNPVVQILGRIAFTTMFWYSVLKPLTPEIFDAIAATRVFGVQLTYLAHTLRVARFLVVNLTDSFKYLAVNLPRWATQIHNTFKVIGDVVGTVTQLMVGVSAVGFNVFKALVVNPLLLIPLGILEVMNNALKILQSGLQLIVLKTTQYGDAISAALRGNFVPLIKQIASDVTGVVWGMTTAIANAITWPFRMVAKYTYMAGAEIIRFLQNPVRELNRLNDALINMAGNWRKTFSTYLQYLPMEDIINFLQRFKVEILGISVLIAQITNVFGLAAIRFNPLLLAIESIGFLIYEYKTGFKVLHGLIDALSHPIAALNLMIKGIFGTMGAYITPGMTNFMANFAEGFVKNIPLIVSGIFLIALVIKRNIGQAFMLFVDGIRLSIEKVRALGTAIGQLKSPQNPQVQSLMMNARLQAMRAEYAVRGQDRIMGMANPLAYSTNPQLQERAAFIGSQIELVKELMSVNKEANQELNKLIKQEEKRLIQMARSRNEQDRIDVLGYIERENAKGRSYRHQLEQAAKVTQVQSSLGKRFELTELGRKTARENAKRLYQQQDGNENIEKSMNIISAYERILGQTPDVDVLGQLGDIALGVKNPANLMDQITNKLEMISSPRMNVDKLTTGVIQVTKPGGFGDVNQSIQDVSKMFDSQIKNNLDQVERFAYWRLESESVSTHLDGEVIKNMLKSSSTIRGIMDDLMTGTNITTGLEASLKEYNEIYRLFGGNRNFLDVEGIMSEASYSALSEGNRKGMAEKVSHQIMSGFLDVLSQEISGIEDSMTADLRRLQSQNIRNSERIATSYQDMLMQGAERIYSSNRDAFNDQSLAAKIFRLTGLPQLYQQIKFNRQLGIRARQLEQNAENLRFGESMREATAQRQRQAGYQALLSNLRIEGNLAEKESFLKAKLGDRLHNILQNYLQTGERFRVDLFQINNGYKDILNAIRIPQLADYAENPLMGMHKVLRNAISNDEFGLTQEILDDFRKNLVKGGSDWKKFIDDLDRGGQIEDVLNINLKRLRASLIQAQERTANDSILSDIADVLGSGKFSAKATKEEEEELLAKLGLNYRQYKNLGDFLPNGFFAPILAKLTKWQENITDNLTIADHQVNNIFEFLKTGVKELPLIEQTALPTLEKAQSLWGKTFETLNKVTKGSFEYVAQEITQIRDNIAELSTVQAVQGLQSEVKAARENTLLNLIETRGKGQRPQNVAQFQKAFAKELKNQGIQKQTDTSRIIATFLQAGQEDQSLSQMLSSEFADNLDTIRQAFSKAIGVTVAEASEAMNDSKFTARAATPVQFIFLRTLPTLFSSFAKDVSNSFVGRGVKFITKKVATDVLRGFSAPSLEAIASFSRRTSAVLGRGFNIASNSLIRMVGNNSISKNLQSLSQLMLKFGDKTSTFVDQVRNTIDQPSATRFIIQKLSGLFGVISEGVQNLYDNVKQEVERQGSVGNFLKNMFRNMVGGVKSFFQNLFKPSANVVRMQSRIDNLRIREQSIINNPRLSAENRQNDFKTILLLRGRQDRARQELEREINQTSIIGKADKLLNNLMSGLGKNLPKMGDRLSQIMSGRLGNLQTQRSRAQRNEGQESYYGQTVVPVLDQAFNSILEKGQSITNQIANFFKNTAERSRRSWEESGRGIIGKGWKALVDAAKHTGQRIKHFIAHNSPGPASDVERIYREEVPREAAKGFHRMEVQAAHTGQQIRQQMSHAAQQTTGFFRHTSSAISGFWQAGLGIGAALSATGFGLQSLGYSLVNLGVLEDGDRLIAMFDKMGEVMGIVGAIGSVASPLLSASLSLVGAVTSSVFALGGAITGVGGAIAGIVGLSEVAFAPFLLGIAAVGVAIAGLYFAFKHNFLGIKTIATVPINFIKAAWQGFVNNFGVLLSPVKAFAENLGGDLIRALNCHPTIRITEAWSNTVDNVQNFMGSLLGSAQKLGAFITSKVAGAINKLGFSTDSKGIKSLDHLVSTNKEKHRWFSLSEISTQLKSIGESLNTLTILQENQIQNKDLSHLKTINSQILRELMALNNKSRLQTTGKEIGDTTGHKGQLSVQQYREFRFSLPQIKFSGEQKPEQQLLNEMGASYNKKKLFGLIDTSGGFGLNKKARFEYKVYEQLYNEQANIIKEILNKSQSASALVREKYQGLIQQINGKTVLSDQGQKYIERQLAQQIQKGTGIFSKNNLSQLAQTSGLTNRLEKQGLTVDRATLVDIALRNQGALSDARNLFGWENSIPNQNAINTESNWNTKISNYLDKITTAVTAIAELIFSEKNVSSRPLPSVLTSSGSNNIVSFKPQPQPSVSLQEKVGAMIKTEVNAIGSFLKEGMTPRIGDRKPVQYKINDQISVKDQILRDIGDQSPVSYNSLSDSIKENLLDIERKTKSTVNVIESIFSQLFDNIQTAWQSTTQFIFSKVGWLINILRPQGYEIQKALSEGSPGPSLFTRENWSKTFKSINDGFSDLLAKAKDTGRNLFAALAVPEDNTLKDQIAESLNTAIALKLPPIEKQTFNPFKGLHKQFEETTWQIKERMDYLHQYGLDHAGSLLTPGIQQVGKSLQIFGGDILSFVSRSAKAIVTLDFFELADAAKDFGGNAMYALKGVVGGLTNVGMGVIAITASLPALLAPLGIAALIFGGIVFSSAVLTSNMLGLRTIIKGVFQVFIGSGEIVWNVLKGITKTVKALGVIGVGVFKALKGDFIPLYEGIDMLRHALGGMGEGILQGLKRIGFGFQDIFKGVLQGWNQVFPTLRIDIDRFFETAGFYFNLMKDGRVAGELLASALVNGIRTVINSFKLLGNTIITTLQTKFTESIAYIRIKFNQLKTFLSTFQWQDLLKIDIKNIVGNLSTVGSIIKSEITQAFNGLPDILKAPFIYLKNFVGGFSSQLIKELGIQKFIDHLKQEWRVFLSVLDIDPQLLGNFGVIADKIRQSWTALSNTIGQKINYIKQEWKVFSFMIETGTFLPYLSTVKEKWRDVFTSMVPHLQRLWTNYDVTVTNMSSSWISFREKLGADDWVTKALNNLVKFSDRFHSKIMQLAQIPIFYNIAVKLAAINNKFKDFVITIAEKWQRLSERLRTTNIIPDILNLHQNFPDRFNQFTQDIQNKWSKLINYIQTEGFAETLIVGINKVQVKWMQLVGWLNRTPLFLNIFSEVNNLSRRYTVAMRQMRHKWLQFREILGSSDWITESLSKIKAWATGFEERLVNVASNVPIFGRVIDALFDLNNVFIKIINWIEKKWQGLSNFLRNTSLIPNFLKLNQEVGKGMAWLSETAKAEWQQFLNWINNTNLFDKFFDKLRAIAPQIPGILQSVISEVKTGWERLMQNLPKTTDEAINRVIGAWVGLKQKVSNILSTLLTFIKDVIGRGIIRALNCHPTVVIPQAWEQAGERIKNTLMMVMKKARGIGKRITKSLTKTLPYLNTFWKGFKDGFENSIKPAISELKPTVISTFDALVSRLKQTGLFAEKLKQYFTDLRQSMRSISQTPVSVPGGQTNLGELFAKGLGTGIRLLNKTLKLLTPVVSLVEKLTIAVGGFSVSVVASVTQRVLPPLMELWHSFKKILRIANLIGNGVQAAFNLVSNVIGLVVPGIRQINTETRETRHQFSLLFKAGKALGAFIGEIFVLPIRAINLLVTAIDGIVSSVIGVKNTFTTTFDVVQNQIEGFKTKVETVKETVNTSFITPLNAVKNKWANTTDFIGNTINKLRGRTEGVGREIQGNIAEASPGPTFMIRKYWGLTTDYILNQVKTIASSSQRVDRAFEGTRSALMRLNQESRQMANPLKHLGLSAMPSSLKELKSAYGQMAKLAHPDMGGSSQHFNEVNRAYEQLKSQMRGGINVPLNADTRSSVGVGTAQMRNMARLSREQMGSLRQGFTSLGMALSNFAPQLATPMFMTLDLVDAFADLKTALPIVKTLLFGTQAAANVSSTAMVVGNTAVAGSATTTAATVTTANTAMGVSSLTMGGIFTSVQGLITAGFGAISSAATATWVAVTGPLFPLIAALGLVAGVVGGLYLGFKHNFLGIQDIVLGTWKVLKTFFDTLFGGAWEIIKSVLKTFEETVNVIFEAFIELGKAIISPFTAILGINTETANFFNILQKGATNLANFLLLPLRAVAFVINTILKGIQLITKISSSVLLTIIPYISPILIGLKTIVTIGKILFKVFNFTFKVISGVISLLIQPLLKVGNIILRLWLLPIQQVQSALGLILFPFKAIANIAQSIRGFIFNLISPLRGIFGLLGRLPILKGLVTPLSQTEPVQKFSTGGWVNGPGTGTSDSINAFLSNGEFVVNARAAADTGPLLEKINEGKLETVYRDPYDAIMVRPISPAATATKKEIGDIKVNFEFSGNIIIQGEGKDKQQLAAEILEELVVQFGPQIDSILKERLTYMTELTKG